MGKTPIRPVVETTEQCKARWTKAFQPLIGRKIVHVSWLKTKECAAMGWDDSSIAITLDNDTTLFPSRDDEGNGAGALFIANGVNAAVKVPEVAPVI